MFAKTRCGLQGIILDCFIILKTLNEVSERMYIFEKNLMIGWRKQFKYLMKVTKHL